MKTNDNKTREENIQTRHNRYDRSNRLCLMLDKHNTLWNYEVERGEIMGKVIPMTTVRPRGTDKAEMMQVIKTTSLLGQGIEKDPVRWIYQYWDLEGNLLASHDTLEDAEVVIKN